MFPYLFALFLAAILVFDYIFMRKSLRRTWSFLVIVFVCGAFVSLFPSILEPLTTFLGVGRTVDAVIYIVTAILIRELFLSRARDEAQRSQMTDLVRVLAIRDAKEAKPRDAARAGE